MKSLLTGMGFTIMSLLSLMGKPASAAVFRAAYPACQDKEILRQAFQNPKDAGGAKAAAFLKGKVDSGACVLFTKGSEVSIDERDGALWCVRRAGDLDCVWTLDQAVDPNPPIQSNGGGSGGSSGGRKSRR